MTRAAPVEGRGQPRADQLLVERGLAESRTAAQRMIAAGRVGWWDLGVVKPVRKASDGIPASAELLVTPDDTDRFVSRGGLKLAGALQETGLDVQGWHCLDVGQSTGGFTDCLLQAGAASVLGVEVGHGQLHPRLVSEPRCKTIEGLNARELSRDQLGSGAPVQGFDLIVCDASFISLTLLLPRWPALLASDGRTLALAKPQFELGPQALGKGGIVRDAARYADVEARIRQACAEAELEVLAWCNSPITGGDGNHEFFVCARKVQR
ncbi:MAG: TlyA family rRNA (cytidine-2'-O)-methyltransferase [Candidatus Dactylopiibacterium carminicum]|nr:MAG: TlyA family rRNA (cytidine-2'-O)-methyltransferase [Candidatus Dactylopiibacterium carminicum]